MTSRRKNEQLKRENEDQKGLQRMAGGYGRMEEGRKEGPLGSISPSWPTRSSFSVALLPLPGRHLRGDFPRHLREGANETLGVGIDPRRRPGDARSKTPGLPGARERPRSSR